MAVDIQGLNESAGIKLRNIISTARKTLKSNAVFPWLLIIPSAIFLIILVGFPLAEAIRLSFTNSSLMGEQYVGLANYEKLFNSKKFMSITYLTFYWMVLSVSLKMVLGLIGAVALNAAVPGQALFRLLVMPPWIVPIAIGCFAWLWMYNGHFGIISGVLQRVGILQEPFEFLAYKHSAFFSAIITDVWVGVPMVTLFILAGLQGVPKDLYEAAYVDGASRWYRFRRITLPLILPVLITISLLSIIGTFNSFEIIWILTEGGPRGATTTLIIDTYRTAISNFKFGQGSARAVIVVVLLSVFSLIYLFTLKKINKTTGVK